MKIGIIKKAKNAKEQTEIANEKEMIELAITQAMTKDRFGKITKEGLEEHINKNIGEGKTQVIDDGDMIVVKFVESNRYYEIDIEAYMVGGMKDWLTGGKIFNCINYGTITITGKDYQYGAAGGIAGAVKGNLIIENCVNEGDVNGEITRAGIVGYANEANIRNCINKGKSSAGIVSWIGPGTTNIINCYNLGECNNGLVNSFTGAAWNSILELNIKNSYNLGKVSNSGIIGAQGTTCAKITLNIENCYNAGSSDNAILGKVSYDTKTETAINITNTYYDTTKSVSVGIIEDGITGLSETEIKNNTSFIEKLNNNIGTNAEWKKWEIGKDGYPTFE